MTERYISIASDNATLSAILHTPASDCAIDTPDIGVLIIVGGPQYRVGSHRQFVKLSRFLAMHHVPSMRLDSSGMGDSSGTKPAFYQQHTDIKLAIDAFCQQCPQLQKIVLWGLCDAASAALLYCYQQTDSRLAGLVLINPLVRQQHSHAWIMLKHYYRQQLGSKVFWYKVFKGKLNLLQSVRSLFSILKQFSFTKNKIKASSQADTKEVTAENYVHYMLAGWQAFADKTLVITSGSDLTAQEFLTLCQTDSAWAGCLQKASHRHITAANHTFSTAEWRAVVEQATCDFTREFNPIISPVKKC